MTEASEAAAGRMKARAPPPPHPPQPAPRHILTNSVPDRGGTLALDVKENLIRLSVDFELTLPQGYRTSLTEDGSKALMDLLVDLCSRYHLNPALHTLELLSPEGHALGFKPNLLLGSLNVACVFIKEKACEEKAVLRRPAPKVPEKTVRLMLNYHSGQKAVVRVNPSVPLQALKPVICEKCELDPTRVQLLKDSISREELPLDKSLTQLGIKELYVLDKSQVLQSKLASIPALNYSDSICSSTASLDTGTKKGLFGLFQLGRRKSKTETTSFGMDDPNDKVTLNAGQSFNGLPTGRGHPGIEDHYSTLTQSQSVINIFGTSPKSDTKKRRAPAPPPGVPTSSMGHSNLEACQTFNGSESQQRKRKAPAPPSTLSSITPDVNKASAFSTPTPVNHASVKPSPAFRNNMTQSTTVTSTTVSTVRPQSMRIQVNPPSSSTVTPKGGSPTPSSSTSDSQVIQDSSSEVSRSPDDSDLDTDDTLSHYSTRTSSTASGSVPTQAPANTSIKKMRELDVSSKLVPASTSISRTESESFLNPKVDEAENRHSEMGTADLQVPPKPRRSPALEHPPLHSPSLDPIKSRYSRSTKEKEDSASQSWLYSMQSTATDVKVQENERPEEETLSLGSSSSRGSSLPDQGYAASEGMVDGEDSGLVSSPSDTYPTSPEGSLFLERSSKEEQGERLPGPVRDISSDSDEGCATWSSYESRNKLQGKSGRTNGTYEEKYKWLHHTNLVADISECPRVPVSVVDMDIPVTAIDEIVDEENIATRPTGPKLSHSKGSEGAAEWCNKNNNAFTASTNKSSIVNSRHVSQPEQYRTPLEKAAIVHTDENTICKKTHQAMTKGVKEDKQRPFADFESQEQSKHMIKNLRSNPHCLPEDSPVLSPASHRSLSTERVETHSVYQNNSSSILQRKVTCNPTSRCGMKTFTVVPPKASVLQGAKQNASASITASAITIECGGGGHHNNRVDPTQSLIANSDGAPLVGKAKAFWSSSERKECAGSCSKGVIDKPKESLDNFKNTPTSNSETTLTTDRRKELVKTHRLNHSAESTLFKETGHKRNESLNSVFTKQHHAEIDILAHESIKQPPQAQDFSPFLKTNRRTSSQYVASAINKYIPKTFTKTNIVSFPAQSSPLTQPNVAFRSLGRSIQVNPRQSSKISLIDNKFDKSGMHHPGPVRSKSYPEFVSDSHSVVKEDKGSDFVESAKDSLWSLGPVSDKIKHFQSSCSPQMTLTDGNIRQVNSNRCQSPTASQSSPLQLTAKPPTKCLTADVAKPELSCRKSDSADTFGPPPVNIFGPVKKFKPVICRSVDRETSLHSNLMEAIQASGGKDGLKKICSSRARSKEASSNESARSALLAAIRAQSSSERLRKTKSGAADELQRCRNAAFKEEQRKDVPSSPSTVSLTCSSPFFTSSSPSILSPPPPLSPFLHQAKHTAVARPSANALTNPALAREAMMEAIRSGAAAENLKRVAVPTKTVKVNGRLGTINATSSKLSLQ
ncbi:protein cordon-bleu-like isoform X2 [Entelurus aequoreus]|nr:protein cordon-bleu-like isoform X2 [Entelurus aequoreus]XP_061919419.1 protein cordon-bleu-like isoform X2 [Entelurus aequoreus]XP_061919421.1 protein cordon-bleu-like isoform X2 [Entelurus aequoreus]